MPNEKRKVQYIDKAEKIGFNARSVSFNLIA
jgi:hypothetical protein